MPVTGFFFNAIGCLSFFFCRQYPTGCKLLSEGSMPSRGGLLARALLTAFFPRAAQIITAYRPQAAHCKSTALTAYLDSILSWGGNGNLFFQLSRLFGSRRNSRIPMVTIPCSSRRGFMRSFTRTIFLKESSICRSGRFSCSSFSVRLIS